MIFAVALFGVRRPLVIFGIYAGMIPFASLIRIPIGLPSPFDTFSTLAGLAATGALVVHLTMTPQRGTRLSETVPLWLLFLGFSALTFAWSVDREATAEGIPILTSLIALYVVVALVRVELRDVRFVENAIVLGGAITGMYALYLLATNGLHLTGAGELRFESAGGGGDGADPNITAAALVLPFVLAMAGVFRSRFRARMAYSASAALILVAVILTGSRGGLTAMTLGLLVLVATRRKGIIAVVGVIAVAVIAFNLIPGSTTGRVDDTDSTGRTQIWQIGLQACPTHCLTGGGLETFPTIHEEILLDTFDAQGHKTRIQAHSMWLGTLVEIGSLGLTLLVIGFLLTFREIFRLPPARRGPPLAALLGLLVTNTFLDNVAFKYWWLVLTYALLVSNIEAPAPDDEPDVAHQVFEMANA
jgi:hypothetical protein